MTRYIYCLYDKVAEKFLPVFDCNNDSEAVRMIRHQFKENPYDIGDYELICMAKMVINPDCAGAGGMDLYPVDQVARVVPLGEKEVKNA